ncbi:MAG: hypothetical protein JW885_02290 [Deltaproteobacteria bacterium]|nr:hypothetical protein [Candidatus Zymogenaceae bacterium]
MTKEYTIETGDAAKRRFLDRINQGGRIDEKELSLLSFEERLWIIQRTPVRGKARVIIASPDSIQLLKKLSPQELYLTIKESWSDDAALLMEMISPDKLTYLLDMDIWKRDRIDLDRFLEWLQLISEGGERPLIRQLFSLDPPLLVLFFKGVIEVTSRNLDQDPLEMSDGGWTSFDDSYYFKPRSDEIDLDMIVTVLTRFFELEPSYYHVIMEGVKGEFPSPLEEEAYDYRSARMTMIGFPEFYEAREILLYEDPEKISREMKNGIEKIIYLNENQEDELPPHYWLIPRSGEGILEDLLVEADGLEGDRPILWELSYLIHKLVAAGGVDLSDTDEIMSSARMARDYINIGLEYADCTAMDEGRRLLREVYLQQLFRLGYCVTLDVVRRMSSLVKRLGQRIDPSLWGGTARAVIDGLTGVRPYYYVGLTESGEDFRNFSTMADIRTTMDFLDTLSNVVLFVSELVDIPVEIESYLKRNAPIQEWGLDHLFATALVRRILMGDWEVIPVTSEELRRVTKALDEGGAVPGTVRDELEELIDRMAGVAGVGFGDTARELVQRAADGLFPELCGMEPEHIDARFISGVITQVSQTPEPIDD